MKVKFKSVALNESKLNESIYNYDAKIDDNSFQIEKSEKNLYTVYWNQRDMMLVYQGDAETALDALTNPKKYAKIKEDKETKYIKDNLPELWKYMNGPGRFLRLV